MESRRRQENRNQHKRSKKNKIKFKCSLEKNLAIVELRNYCWESENHKLEENICSYQINLKVF